MLFWFTTSGHGAAPLWGGRTDHQFQNLNTSSILVGDAQLILLRRWCSPNAVSGGIARRQRKDLFRVQRLGNIWNIKCEIIKIPPSRRLHGCLNIGLRGRCSPQSRGADGLCLSPAHGGHSPLPAAVPLLPPKNKWWLCFLWGGKAWESLMPWSCSELDLPSHPGEDFETRHFPTCLVCKVLPTQELFSEPDRWHGCSPDIQKCGFETLASPVQSETLVLGKYPLPLVSG